MTGREEMRTTAEMLNMSMSSNCSTKYIVSGDAEVTGNYFAIQIINDTIFSKLIDENNEEGSSHDLAATELSGIGVPAGIVIYGDFTNIDLTSGIICAFKVD